MPKQIVIVGGGFGGVQCAKRLRHHLSEDDCAIVLFDYENHMVFHPLLAEVAGASIHPDAAAVPLRQMLSTIFCRTERVVALDFSHKQVEYEGHLGARERLSYDHLVLACGGDVNMGLVPGMADHGFPLKTIGDAMLLRSHVIQQLEKAEVTTDPEQRKTLLSFIVVGGGFSGVEIAGELNDFARKCCRYFHGLSKKDIQVTLIHSRDKILPELSSLALRDFALEKMQKAGIQFVLNARVVVITANGVRLNDQRVFHGHTVVTATGNAPTNLIQQTEGPKEKGILMAEPDMRLKGLEHVWALGDCAQIINAYDGQRCPTTAQFAERQGRQAADNIMRVIQQQPTRPFYYRPQGLLCSIGGKRAVAEIMGIRVWGFLAWFLWRGIYLFKMPTWSRRIKIGFDWAWDLFFSVDLVYFTPKATERLATAYYQTGDYIFKQNDPALNFYVIEEGEVEVVRKTKDTHEESVVTVLGAGDFFGEMALLDKRPHSAGTRARTPVRVLVLGSQLFMHISETLTPLKTILMEAARKRQMSVWQRVPQAQPALEHKRITEFVETPPCKPVLATTTFADVLSIFNEHHMEVVFVVDEAGLLKGLVTRTDLFNAIADGARRETPIQTFMVQNPLSLGKNEPVELAISIMRDRHFKWLPIVDSREIPKFVGYIRAQKLLEVVLTRL